MKKLSRTSAVVVFTAVMAISSLGGTIDSPGVASPPPPPSQTSSTSTSVTTTMILAILSLIR